MVMIEQFDYLFGSKIIVQCKQQINIINWKRQNTYCSYLIIIGKPPEYFSHWSKLRGAVTCIVGKPPSDDLSPEIKRKVGTEIDNMLQEGVCRVLLWSQGIGRIARVPSRGRGHGKQMGVFKQHTFCAKDREIKSS